MFACQRMCDFLFSKLTLPCRLDIVARGFNGFGKKAVACWLVPEVELRLTLAP